MNQKLKILTEKLRDERSKKVLFVAHCLLNENARFLAIAFREGCVDEIVDELQEKGIGIVQMPCPEHKAWGGVLRRFLLLGFDSKNTLFYKFRGIILPLFIWNTKRVFKKVAKGVVKEIKDYIDSGFEVLGIVGNKGSPSCGLSMTMDLRKSFDYIAGLGMDTLDREKAVKFLIEECLFEGRGFFIEALENELQKRDMKVKFYEHDFVSEYRGEKTKLKLF